MIKKRPKFFATITAASALIFAFAYTSSASQKAANEIKISPQNVRAASGKPYKKAVKTDSGTVKAWILSGNFDESVEAVLEKMPEGFRGLKIEIETAPVGNADASKERYLRR